MRNIGPRFCKCSKFLREGGAADATMVCQQDKHTPLSLLTNHEAEFRLTCLTTFNLFSNRNKSIIHRSLHILHCDAKPGFCSIQLQCMSYGRDYSVPSSTNTLISIHEYFFRFNISMQKVSANNSFNSSGYIYLIYCRTYSGKFLQVKYDNNIVKNQKKTLYFFHTFLYVSIILDL